MAVYPATLPTPSLSGNSSKGGETFFRSKFEFATRQRVTYCSDYYVSFNFLLKSSDLMKEFKDFYYTTLAKGMLTFTADWEIEGVSGEKQFRFSERYKPKTVRAGIYEVSATFELVTKIKDL